MKKRERFGVLKHADSGRDWIVLDGNGAPTPFTPSFLLRGKLRQQTLKVRTVVLSKGETETEFLSSLS